MPEYLTPGVYVEETSFRSKTIEGVPTSTFGMAGVTRYGPVSYTLGAGPDLVQALITPTLVTSFTEFERAFGDLADVHGRTNYLAHGARAFFANGGRRLYISRVFPWFKDPNGRPDPGRLDETFAGLNVGDPALARWRARWPGSYGAGISVQVELRRGRNIVVPTPAAGGGPARTELTGVRPGCSVEIFAQGAEPPRDTTRPVENNVRVVAALPDRTLGYQEADGGITAPQEGQAAYRLRLAVTVRVGTRLAVYNELELDESHPRSVFTVLRAQDPADEFSLVCLKRAAPAAGQQPPTPGRLLVELLGDQMPHYLTGGGDGEAPTPGDLKGETADLDVPTRTATGLEALGEVEDIAIVAMPDSVGLDADSQRAAVGHLIEHCTRLRYRMAVVDPPKGSSITSVRGFRAQFDTTYGALYYPWLDILDPSVRPEAGTPPPILSLPPSGFVAGIYARSDIERGVHKAPANEVLFGLTRFDRNITFDQQSVLNPEGINALRFFEGRSNRVWGARTMSSDPEWKYVNVRRLFIYLEHSIEKATQWAVFEPNNERLWSSIRQSIEDFLLVVWRTGALMGTRPEEAYFVRCDRTTMAQNDLDNGRMICLIGVAPTYPAEFVIFRIGQWTADAQRS